MFIDTEVHLVVDIACMNRGGGELIGKMFVQKY